MKKIYKFNEFKLIKESEAEGEEDEFNFDESESESEGDEGNDFDDMDIDSEEEFGENEEGEETEEDEEEEKEITYNEDPSYYVENSIKTIERTITQLFENPLEDAEDKIAETDPSSYYEQGVELINIKKTDMPLNKTLIVKYHDSEYTYHLLFTVNIEQGISKDGEEMNSDMIEQCGVKFKKYDLENKLIGEIEKKKIDIKDINQDFIDTLNGELDTKYSVKDDFEIENVRYIYE
jgi:hypothetical protein